MTSPGLVLVSHNSLADLREAIASARDAGFARIVVADAGSTDGTAATIAATFPEVRVLELPNLGYGACANLAVRQLVADRVVIANADVTFEPDSAAAFDASLDDRGVGIVGPLVVHPDGTRQHSARLEPTVVTAVLHAIGGLWWPTNPWTRRYRGADLVVDRRQPVDWVSGCCLAVRREVFDELNGFDPGFFLFMEDVDLAHRARAAGHQVIFDPSVRVAHRVGGALDQDRSAARRAHARSLVRWTRQRHGVIAAALVAFCVRLWRLSALAYDRTRGRQRPSTGEQTERRT